MPLSLLTPGALCVSFALILLTRSKLSHCRSTKDLISQLGDVGCQDSMYHYQLPILLQLLFPVSPLLTFSFLFFSFVGGGLAGSQEEQGEQEG